MNDRSNSSLPDWAAWLLQGALSCVALFVSGVITVWVALETKSPGVAFIVFVVLFVIGAILVNAVVSRNGDEEDGQNNQRLSIGALGFAAMFFFGLPIVGLLVIYLAGLINIS